MSKRAGIVWCGWLLGIAVCFAQRDYTLIWSDDFDRSEIDGEKWNFEQGGGGWGNRELQYYTDRSENARIEGGCLVIEARKEEYGGRNFTSARLTTKGKGFAKYGKIEARISLPQGRGTWPAFWLMPEKNVYGTWPRSGEIDMMEHIGSNPEMISYAVHTQQRNGSKGNNWNKQVYPGPEIEGEFHLYGIEWLDDRIEFYFDGEKQATLYNDLLGNSNTWPFDQEFYVILNVAIGGNMGGTVDESAFDRPVEMKVDYVRIYASGISGIEEKETIPCKIWPNPFSDRLVIKSDVPAPVKVTDVSGRILMELPAEKEFELNTSSWIKGFYFLTVGEESRVSKVYKLLKN